MNILYFNQTASSPYYRKQSPTLYGSMTFTIWKRTLVNYLHLFLIAKILTPGSTKTLATSKMPATAGTQATAMSIGTSQTNPH
jgi:hypothetical protein